ncbi:protein phosphatase 1 regulatory subunit 12A-like isoform X1 [Gordionus sp. m RMFG-2023]|uniref:protein phosphatase 1 regulatory subunit 12A-like isoform X1 n=1 Tax=Gordionus sp. m RMFG-2023 TaxID=3053472 RepID=UPI0031FC66B4
MKMHDENSGPKFTAMKRGEQIKRWEDSDINKESSQSRQANKIRFLDSTIFLAACSAGDVEEVKKLLKRGVDINTPNIDGLTALHQACIDDNILMVEFLIKHGANINQGDNEGWTPLHAASSCGFLEIVQYLVKCGANIAAVNSDGELPIDITESLEIEKFLQSEIDRKGIVMNEARNEEINKMTRDAKLWIRTNVIRDRPHPKTGATALHVASAKGYTSVIELLLEAGVNIDARDYDGWTPLHAACHWNQKEAVRTLLNHGADPGLKDNSSLIPAEVGDNAMARYMDDIKNENKLCKEKMTTILAPTKTTVNITHNIPIKSKQAQPLGAESETHSTTVSRMSGVEKLRLNTEDHASERNINLSGGANNKKFKAEVPHEEETASSSSASSSSLTTSSSSIESGKIAAGVKKLSQTNIAAKDVEKPEVAKVKYSITAKTTPQPTVHATEEKITITKPKMLTTINKKEIGKPIANKETSDSGSESEDSSEASTSNTSSTSSSHHSDDHLKKGENKLNNAVKLADSRIGVGNTKEKSTVTFTGTSPVTQHQKPSSFVTPLQTPANTVKPQQHTFTPMNTRLSISSSSSSSSSTHNNTMLGGLLTKYSQPSIIPNMGNQNPNKRTLYRFVGDDNSPNQSESTINSFKRSNLVLNKGFTTNNNNSTQCNNGDESSSPSSPEKAFKFSFPSRQTLPFSGFKHSNNGIIEGEKPLNGHLTDQFRTNVLDVGHRPLNRPTSLNLVKEDITINDNNIGGNINTDNLNNLNSSVSPKLLAKTFYFPDIANPKNPSHNPNSLDSNRSNEPNDSLNSQSQYLTISCVSPTSPNNNSTVSHFTALLKKYQQNCHTNPLGSVGNQLNNKMVNVIPCNTNGNANQQSTIFNGSNLNSGGTLSNNGDSVQLNQIINKLNPHYYFPFYALPHGDRRTPSSANIGLQQSSLASSASSVLSDQVSSQREVASEAQRKARSKRARESRRSTQGVSAEDIKAAEKQLEEIDIRSNSPGNEKQITTSKITKDEPSQKLPTSSSSSILNIAQKMEEKTARVFPLLKNNESNISNDTNTSSSQSNGGSNSSTNRRPVKDYEERRKILEEQRQKALEERKAGTTANKMELSGKPPQVFPTNATSNSIPPTLESKRHLREKRRSTGICSFNVEKQSDQLPGDNSRDTKVHEDYSKEETNPANYEESHSANYHSRNRVVSSTTAKTSTASNINDNTATIDYKKLYDETRLENVKLKSKIKDLEKELQTSKGDRKILAEIKPSSDYNSDNSSQSTLSRKEKRNLEIKISELEEELKKMESLKEVNQRLKHENGALIRVISKLSK